MALWAIADIHGSTIDPRTGEPSKPMDVFGENWTRHMSRVGEAWQQLVAAGDTVIVAGDIDWALRVEEARDTLEQLGSWPGRKILVRGNHDYWWSSKTTNKVRRALPDGIELLHNNALQADGFNICGTKGAPVPGGIDWTDQDARLLQREEHRLLLSLGHRVPTLPTIVALHYPPFYMAHPASPFRAILEQEGVCLTVYGHLHGVAAGSGPSGRHGNLCYRLVAADALAFRPLLVGESGAVVAERCTGQKLKGGQDMSEERVDLDELRGLAEQEIDEKRRELGSEAQARELYDVPTESDKELAEQQRGPSSGDR